MEAFAAAGLEAATLGVDAENPTGALGVYERVGFRPIRRWCACSARTWVGLGAAGAAGAASVSLPLYWPRQ